MEFDLLLHSPYILFHVLGGIVLCLCGTMLYNTSAEMNIGYTMETPSSFVLL
jgi:hypothetical protein